MRHGNYTSPALSNATLRAALLGVSTLVATAVAGQKPVIYADPDYRFLLEFPPGTELRMPANMPHSAEAVLHLDGHVAQVTVNCTEAPIEPSWLTSPRKLAATGFFLLTLSGSKLNYLDGAVERVDSEPAVWVRCIERTSGRAPRTVTKWFIPACPYIDQYGIRRSEYEVTLEATVGSSAMESCDRALHAVAASFHSDRSRMARGGGRRALVEWAKREESTRTARISARRGGTFPKAFLGVYIPSLVRNVAIGGVLVFGLWLWQRTRRKKTPPSS